MAATDPLPDRTGNGRRPIVRDDRIGERQRRGDPAGDHRTRHPGEAKMRGGGMNLPGADPGLRGEREDRLADRCHGAVEIGRDIGRAKRHLMPQAIGDERCATRGPAAVDPENYPAGLTHENTFIIPFSRRKGPAAVAVGAGGTLQRGRENPVDNRY
jgi:hypothetical protein